MSPEERQLLQGLFDRIRSGAANTRDREAEAFIADNVRQQPYAPYLLAQTVIVQDQALRAANDRLQQLEAQVADLQRQSEPPQQPGSGGFLSGLGSIFGGGGPSQQAAPPASRPWGQPGGAPQGYAPPQSGGPSQSGGPWGGQPPQGQWGAAPAAAPSGGGFLHGALGAAAGVAGGVLLADSIRGLFGGHNNGLGIASGLGGLGGGGLGQGGFGGGETIVNNYYGDDPGAAGGGYQQDAGYQQDIGDGLDDMPGSTDYSDDV